jgi:hypothetical protein
VTKAKTPKGVRRIPLPLALREELTLWRADAAHTRPGDYVIHTSTGRKHNPLNLRRDVLSKAIEAADGTLVKAGIRPIEHVTFHGLQRTFASLRSYLGKPIRQTADLLGHEDVRFTLNVYAQSTLEPDEMLRRSGNPSTAASNGHKWAQTARLPLSSCASRQQKAPSSGASEERMMGLEPTTFCMAKASGRAAEAVIEKTAPHLTRPSSLPGCPVRFTLRDHAR